MTPFVLLLSTVHPLSVLITFIARYPLYPARGRYTLLCRHWYLYFAVNNWFLCGGRPRYISNACLLLIDRLAMSCLRSLLRDITFAARRWRGYPLIIYSYPVASEVIPLPQTTSPSVYYTKKPVSSEVISLPQETSPSVYYTTPTATKKYCPTCGQEIH